MSQPATKHDVQKLGETLRDEIRQNTREIISHFNQSQGKQTEWVKEEFQIVNTKLDAIMSGEVLVTRKQFERLVKALKGQGIHLNEAEIFRP